MRRFVLGFLLGLVLPAAAGIVAAFAGLFSVRASAKPPGWETAFARRAFDASVAREAPRQTNPIPATDEELRRGLRLFRGDCAGCHGDFEKPSDWGANFYPPVPQFTRNPPRRPDWQIFWIVKNGVRYSGMGGWDRQISDADVWRVAAFLSRLESLPPSVDAEWKRPR